jgi:transcriptional regulator with XRE-family HTH domain
MARNLLLTAPPYPVDQALRSVGANLRLARLRRGLTIQEVAGKIGTGVRAVADAEKGKPSSGVAVIAALLWAYDLLGPFSLLADPASDSEGEALARGRDPVRARRSKGLDNDF